MKRKVKISLITILVLCLVALILFVLLPRKQQTLLSAICRIDARATYALPLKQGDTLFLSLRNDSLQDAATNANYVAEKHSQTGTFVSNVGDIVTSDMMVDGMPDSISTSEVNRRLSALDSLLNRRLHTQQSELKELDYYARTHTVVDDGYNDVMAYRERVSKLASQTQLALSKVENARKEKHLTAYLHTQTVVRLPHSGDSLTARVRAHHGGLMLVQLNSERLPQQCRRFSVYRWGVHKVRCKLYAFNDLGSQCLSVCPVVTDSDKELYPAAEGGAWVNSSGHFSQVQRCHTRISSLQIVELMQQVHSWPMWWITNFVGWAKSISCTNDKSKTISSKAPLTCTTLHLPDSLCYKGEVSTKMVDGHAMRQGYGVLTRLSDSTRFIGIWHNDSLIQGKCRNARGVYEGQFDANGEFCGKGAFFAANGEYYCGEWDNGKRTGHGFSSKGGQMVRCGSWKAGRFQGERMIYTADRIYGIDLSRYQHEKGRKRFGIDWKRLRITSLGADRRIHGSVDYPVSFVYIKSTEGRSMFNKYYPSDLRQARAHGIATGSYHFFTATSSGAQQAEYFLKMTWIAANDLPPVLDLEPTPDQIKRMGGEAGMFRQVLTWLRIVEKRRGKRPVLYVGQQFVNKHLKNAPSALKNYDVWIARYGEFKPYVKLLHWQVSPYGRVRGIHTTVDVNVFNGSRSDFEKYKAQGRL